MRALCFLAALNVAFVPMAKDEEVLRFASGQGYQLASGWAVTQKADLKLDREHFVSSTGQIALTQEDDLEDVASAPAAGYTERVKVTDAENRVAVLRLGDGTYAKFVVVNKVVDKGNDYAPFSSVTIRYAMFTPRPAGAVPDKPAGQTEKGSAVFAKLIGTWNMRIPTGVAYSPVRTDGTQTMSIIPGAEFGRITVRKDGTYLWEGLAGKRKAAKGRLAPHKPWFAKEGDSYYKISDGKTTYLLCWIPTNRKPVTLVHLEGGAVASGEKLRLPGGSRK